MCVEIVKSEEIISYKMDLSLQDQICGCKEVLIDCDGKCEKTRKFLEEVQKSCQQGINLGFTIKISDNSNLQLYKKTKKLNKDLIFNDIISKVSLLYKNTDDKLKKLSDTLKG